MPTVEKPGRGPAWLVLVALAAVWLMAAGRAMERPAKVAADVASQNQASATTHTVVLKQMHFEPAELSVKPGDTVEWTNQDIFTHTVTADDGSFESGKIAPGKSWRMVVKNPGTFAYHCTPHPNMRARLVAASAAGSTAANVVPRDSGAGKMGEGMDDEGREDSLRFKPPTMPQEIHPILVNFTAALLPLALLSDLLGRWLRRPSLHNAAWWMVLYAAAITPLTVAAGWWWKHAAGAELPARVIRVHQWLGTAAAVLFVALAIWRWSIHKRNVPPSVAYLACAAVAVLALIYQGSLGGMMAFGR